MKTLRLLLGDQLNHRHSWFESVDENTTYVIIELGQKLIYARHHVQKVVAFFLAMRSFAKHLELNGHRVIYWSLDHETNEQDLEKNISKLISEYGFERFEYQLPDEWRLDQELRNFCEQTPIETSAFDTEHFLTSRSELTEFFKGKKQLLMESFYRMMRKKT